ncbi:hypothetical protein N9L06_06945 [Mariniblastus sp.]|nr:hypothetical protein [Mariniblastus sp.]
MSWQFHRTEITDKILKFIYLDEADHVLSFGEVIELWADIAKGGAGFRAFHCQALSDVPFKAYRWETPALVSDHLHEPFEFVVVDDPSLNRVEDQTAFQNQFDAADESRRTLAFPNLGKNAILVVPRPSGSEVNHCHLASFLSTCRAEDESSLWRQVGKSMRQRVSEKPVWLSTAGGGVAWLHVRLDDRPKYYAYQDYKSF